MSDDFTTAAWQQRGQGPTHVVVDNQSASTGGGGGVVSGTVAVSNFPATQPVSESHLPNLDLALTALRDALRGASSKTLTDVVNALAGTLTVSGTVTANVGTGTQPVSGTVSLATNTPDVTDRPARQLGHVAVDSVPTTPVTGPLTDTQLRLTPVPVSGSVTANIGAGNLAGINGTVATRALIDTARTPVVLSVTAVASATTEAMFNLTIWKNGAGTPATSYTVTTGKTLRIQAVQFGARFATPSTTVTFASCRFNLRSGNATNSPLIYGDSKMCSSNAPTPNSDLAIPDGLELPSGTVIGVSHVDSAATLLLDVLIVGYEY